MDPKTETISVRLGLLVKSLDMERVCTAGAAWLGLYEALTEELAFRSAANYKKCGNC